VYKIYPGKQAFQGQSTLFHILRKFYVGRKTVENLDVRVLCLLFDMLLSFIMVDKG